MVKTYISIILICITFFSCVAPKENLCRALQDDWEILIPCYEDKHVETEYHGEKQYTYFYKKDAKFFVTDSNESPNLLSDYLSPEEESSIIFLEELSYAGEWIFR